MKETYITKTRAFRLGMIWGMQRAKIESTFCVDMWKDAGCWIGVLTGIIAATLVIYFANK